MDKKNQLSVVLPCRARAATGRAEGERPTPCRNPGLQRLQTRAAGGATGRGGIDGHHRHRPHHARGAQAGAAAAEATGAARPQGRAPLRGGARERFWPGRGTGPSEGPLRRRAAERVAVGAVVLGPGGAVLVEGRGLAQDAAVVSRRIVYWVRKDSSRKQTCKSAEAAMARRTRCV